MGDDDVPGPVRHMYRTRIVTISPFEMSEREITERQFRTFRNHRENVPAAEDSLPIILKNWTEAAEFCNDLSKKFGLGQCYDVYSWKCDFSKNGLRLPTEAEWE